MRYPAPVLVLSLGCALMSQTRSVPDLDLADLSFLVPPSNSVIPVGGDPQRRPLLSKAIFDQFSDFALRGHPGMTGAYEKLVVTGVRIDPCGPSYPVDWNMTRCVMPNLRVIAQVFENGRVTDAALHMVFALGIKLDQDRVSMQSGRGFDPSIRAAVIRDLHQMKARNAAAGILTTQASVGVHPAFSGEHQTSTRTSVFHRELDAFLRSYATEERYFTTAVMFADRQTGSTSALAGRERWVWQKGNVVRAPKVPIRIVFGGIPGFEPGMKEQSFTADIDRRSGAVIAPQSAIANGSLGNISLTSILKPTADFDWGGLQSAVDIADILDNPDRVFVQTDDCVSCHLATTARSFALADGRLGWVKRSNQFRPSSEVTDRPTMLTRSQLVWQGAGGYRPMSFGFLKGEATVSQRTVNETLQAVRLLRGR